MVGQSRSTVIKQMQEIQDTLAMFDDRVDIINQRLRSWLLLDDTREKLELELQDIEERVDKLKDSLETIRGGLGRRGNNETFAIAVLIMYFSFLGYGLYKMSINEA